MRKVLSVLVILTFLVGFTPEKAQGCLFGDCGPADDLIHQNQRMVNRWSSYDDYGRRGYGYGRQGHHHHGDNDGWLGLGLGAIAGALIYGALSNRDNQVSPPSSMESPMAPYGRENGWNERLRDQQEQANAGGGGDNPPWFGSRPSCRERGMFTLKNETGEVIRIYKNGQSSKKVLLPGRLGCGDPSAEYEAEAVVAVSDGYTARAQVVRAKPEGRSGGIWVWR